METRETIKTWFVRHAKPLEVQFAAWLDSYRHLEDPINISDIKDLGDVLYDTPTKQDLYDLDDKKYDKTGGPLTGKVTIRKSRDGNYFEVVDSGTEAILAEITQDGQFNLYGRAGIANGAINLYTSDKKKRYIINTLNGNIFIELYNANEELKAVIDSAGMSRLFGLNVQNEKIINVAAGELDSDVANIGIVKQLISDLVDSSPETLNTLKELANALGDDPNFATTVSTAIGQKLSKANNLSDLENRQTSVNNLFDAANLGTGQTLIKDSEGNMVAGTAGGASQDSIEFPVPTVYTYTGDYITKVVETITDGIIEKRLRYYISASPIVDGSPDIMEYKNSVTGFWSRATYNYTAGKLTSITTATIIEWSI